MEAHNVNCFVHDFSFNDTLVRYIAIVCSCSSLILLDVPQATV